MVRFTSVCLDSPHPDRATAQMIDGLEQVRNILGDQERSGCTEQNIKDALWEFFFDVEKSVVWLQGPSHLRHLGRVH